MEEAELISWRFVSSAFSLDLSNTKQHLVPGAPFLLQVLLGRAGLAGRGCGPHSPEDAFLKFTHVPPGRGPRNVRLRGL